MKLVICCLFLCGGILADEVIVNLPNGAIRGEKSGPLYTFKGIPYAEAPLGEKRFEPVGIYREKWSGVRNATKYGGLCLQMPHSEYPMIYGMEDCLFLNIFTTSLDSSKKLPVIFYIHGGDFMFDSGSSYTPERVYKYQEVVYVTFNYRVGVMGFLSTENEVVPGNMGLKDQVVALQWVKENIHLFGGNAEAVMITGFSAGGASVHLHYFSPLSVGLFHRGFSQSGCALNPWALSENPRKKATTIAAYLDCPLEEAREMIECLKSRSADDVVRGTILFFSWLYNPFAVFGPVVEKKGTQAFLPDHPEAILRAGKINDLPWIVSLVDSEGKYPVGDFIEPPTKLEELNKRWEELAPSLLDFEGTVVPRYQQEVGKIVRNFYLQEENITRDSIDKLVRIFSDRHFDAGISFSSRLHTQFTSSPNYLVYNTFPAEVGLESTFAQGLKLNGSGHGDDNVILYNAPDVRMHPLNEKEELMVKLYSTLMVNYAAGKEPELGGVKLKAITNTDRMEYLYIKSPDEISVNETEGFGNEKFWYSLPIEEWNYVMIN